MASKRLTAFIVATALVGAYGRQDVGMLSDMPGLARLYDFGTGQAVHPNLAREEAPMVFVSEQGSPPARQPGRTEGTFSIPLDAESFEARAPHLPSNALTVAVWLRPHGKGAKTGNDGLANGMIASCGSGYYDGWRFAVYDWQTRCPSFELGRPEGSHLVAAKDALTAGAWNHLAATWDGARVRVYVNGMLSAEQAFTGTTTPPAGPLKVGYSGYGVGSLRMSAGQLAIFDRALTSDDIARVSMSFPRTPPDLQPFIVRAQAATADKSAPDAAAAYLATAAHADRASAWRHWATLAAMRHVPRTEAERALLSVMDASGCPEHLRAQAATLLLQGVAQGTALPHASLAAIASLLELDGAERRTLSLASADALWQEGRPDDAAAALQVLLDDEAGTPLDRADLRRRFAGALRLRGDRDGARRELTILASDTSLPPHARALAFLSVADTFEEEGRTAESLAACGSAAAVPDRPQHLREEAETRSAALVARMENRDLPTAPPHRRPPPPLLKPAIAFFVAPSGDDANVGTQRHPFATLERARDAIRLRKATGPLADGGATVYVRGGRYAVTNTFELTAADSGTAAAPTVYRAWGDETAVFDGGAAVDTLRTVDDSAILARLPASARGKVLVADLGSQGLPAFARQAGFGSGRDNETVLELFENGAPLQLARWPNEGELRIETVLDRFRLGATAAKDRMAHWAQARDMMAAGYWKYLWADSTVAVGAVDAATGVIRLDEEPGYGLAVGSPFHVQNLLEELDQAGEWYLDRSNGLLYVWPTRRAWSRRLVLSRWDKPFVQAFGVAHLVLEGLTFEHGQQRGLVLDGCSDSAVVGCVVRRLGGTGLVARGGTRLSLYGNILHTLGHAGMQVSGGDRGSLTGSGIVIENNDVGHFGRLTRTYTPALLLDGCGTRVAHNHFHHAPSSAMRIEGNDHLIEYNLVDNVVRESDDQGALDMWRDPSYRGVVIRFNRWMDIGANAACGQGGIRLDDAISGVLIYGNRFERASRGNFGAVQIHGGRDNIVDNNLMLDCRYGVSFSPWEPARWQSFLATDEIRTLLHDQVDIGRPPYSERYPELASIHSASNTNTVMRNVIVNADKLFHNQPADASLWGNRGFAKEPDPAVAARVVGFTPLPSVDDMGLYGDPRRAAE